MRAGFFAICLGVLSVLPALADDLKPGPQQAMAPTVKDNPPSISAAPLTQSDVAALSDGLIPAAIGSGNVAGVVVVVVKDGQVLFQKGYGFADVDKRTPVDPVK